MEDNLKNLNEIFSQNFILRIPDYQRGYSWEKKQLNDFWEDILNLPENKFHYTGVLSLKKLKEQDTINWIDEKWAIRELNYIPIHIIDGQQRLTTFIILLTCLLNKIRKLTKNEDKQDNEIKFDNKILSEIVEQYIVKLSNTGIGKLYKFGYEIDNPSFNYLKKEIFNSNIDIHDTDESIYTLKISEAKKFFNDKLDEIEKKLETNEDQLEKKLNEIFDKITQRLLFVEQNISDKFNAFVAFETMNNRGLSLSNLEKLKNRLIYLSSLYSTKELPETDFCSLRKNINDSWKEVYKYLGKNQKEPLSDDEFLQNHWYIYFGYSRSEKNAYENDLLNKKFIIERVLTSKQDEYLKPKDILNYVQDLAKISKIWYYTYNSNMWSNEHISDEEKKWIEKLNRLQISYFRDIIVCAYTDENISKTTSEKRLKLLQTMERLIFINYRMGTEKAQNSQSEYLKKAKELKEGKINIENIIEQFEQDVKIEESLDNFLKNRIKKYFEIEQNNNFKNKKIGFYMWDSINYFLFEYETSLILEEKNPKIISKDFFNSKNSIEHIYPQTPDGVYYWANKYRFFSEYQKKIICNSLGNLLALSPNANIHNRNYEYVLKRNGDKKLGIRGYINGSYSEIKVANDYQDDWQYEDIKKRGLELLEFLEQRWNIKLDDVYKQELLHLKFDNIDFNLLELNKENFEANLQKNKDNKTKKKEEKINFFNTFNEYLKNNLNKYYSENNKIKVLTFDFDRKIKDKIKVRIELNYRNSMNIVLKMSEKIFGILESYLQKIQIDLSITIDSTKKIIISHDDIDYANENSLNKTIMLLSNKITKIYEYFESLLKEINLNPTKIKEEEYIKSKNGFEKEINLYYLLRNILRNKYTNAKLYATQNYIALKEKYNFVEIHILQNKLVLNVKYCNIDSIIAIKLKYNWSLDYQITIKTSNDFDEALKLIDASYNKVNKI